MSSFIGIECEQNYKIQENARRVTVRCDIAMDAMV